MIYTQSPLAIGLFIFFVLFVLGLSFYLARRTSSAEGYYAAGGNIHWMTNGIAFAGDYLSAASFLGICGMIATSGYDGWMYSIGYLAGWIVALFLVAEPMKRLGKYTFTDALDSKFNSKSIQLMAAISTLMVSVFYLIPQMVGAGVLIQPLLGLPHWAGVLIVGATVIVIVITAGMVSTTWVQFLKGSLLVVFSLVLTVMVLQRGFSVEEGGNDGYQFQKLGPFSGEGFSQGSIAGRTILPEDDGWEEQGFIRLADPTGGFTAFSMTSDEEGILLHEAQVITDRDAGKFVNGLPFGDGEGQRVPHPVGHVSELPAGETETGPLGPLEFFRVLHDSQV